MKVTAWNNGQQHNTGAGYGIKLKVEGRDKYFDQNWKTINLHLPNLQESTEVNINKPSFWGPNCRELIHQNIGKWFLSVGIAPWEKGNPPTLELTQIEGPNFRLAT